MFPKLLLDDRRFRYFRGHIKRVSYDVLVVVGAIGDQSPRRYVDVKIIRGFQLPQYSPIFTN